MLANRPLDYQTPASEIVVDGKAVLDEIVAEGEEYIATIIGPEGLADIERRTNLYDIVAKDFSCQVGKVGVISFPNFSIIP